MYFFSEWTSDLLNIFWKFLDHFCHHFWVGLLLLCCCTHPKVMKNTLKKVFNWSEVHLSEVTSYKIHTLIFNYTFFSIHAFANLTSEDEKFIFHRDLQKKMSAVCCNAFLIKILHKFCCINYFETLLLIQKFELW